MLHIWEVKIGGWKKWDGLKRVSQLLELPLGESNKLSNGSLGEITQAVSLPKTGALRIPFLLSEWVWGHYDFLIAVFNNYIYVSTRGFLSLNNLNLSFFISLGSSKVFSLKWHLGKHIYIYLFHNFSLHVFIASLTTRSQDTLANRTYWQPSSFASWSDDRPTTLIKMFCYFYA